jgi:ATP-dependent DNA helicase RecG
MMSGLTADDLLTDSYQARHRNKLLAESFYLTGDIEKYGTGFIRIRKWLKEYPELHYQFTDLKDFIRVTLSLSPTISIDKDLEKDLEKDLDKVVDKVVEKVVGKVVGNLNSTQQKIVLLMRNDPFITANAISKQIEISHRKVQANIAKLKQKGIIHRLGSDKGGHWEVNN